MRIHVGAKTEVGRVRERNEDAYLVREPLYAVADGMGGHRGGDVASSMTLEALEHVELGRDAPLDALVKAIRQVNGEVLRRGQSDRDLRGMGTTVTAFLTDQDKAYVAHVGDSRAYLLRKGAVQRLTRDHTLVERMVEEGRLPRDQAQHHPQQNILTKVLGVDEDLEVDDLTIDPIQPGDRILLCTDGLSHMVDEDVIERILKGERDPQTAAERLVDAALEAGGEDNVTVLVLDVEEGDPAEASVSSPASAVAEELPTRRWRRALVWLAVLLVVVIAGLIGADVYVSHQWYVGEEAGRVAIYNGIPTKVLWVELSHVEETTELSAARVEQVAYWRSLPDGITADNLQEARGIVDQMRQDVQSIQSPKR